MVFEFIRDVALNDRNKYYLYPGRRYLALKNPVEGDL